jgi:iron complex outermembrane receptor protein
LSFLFALALVLTVVESAAGHDTFIMPDKFRVSSGETLKIGFHSSDAFPESSSLPRRLQNAFLHVAAKTVAISLSEDGKRMVGSVTVPNTGHIIATVVNAAATTTMKPDEFLEYIKEEGLNHVIESRARGGEADKPARERYTMYAKSIFLAGLPNDAYKHVVGLPIEIVPEKDPYGLKNGESLPVRVLFQGAPASGLEVMAASTGSATAKNHSIGRTDAQGRIDVPVTSGQWRLHTIRMERSTNPDAEWESFWATLTFEIRLPASASAQAAGQGELRGRVSDASGLPVPGAEIKLGSAQPAVSPTTVSGANGSFVFNSLKPGAYKLIVARTGFEPATREIAIAADGREAFIEIRLDVATVNESITIVADAGALTATKLDVPLRETPITLNTITNETLYSQGQNDLVGALRNVSSSNSYVSFGVYEAYRLRGFGDAVQLLDGVRNEGNRMNTQLNSIESVEVLKGPASVLYGGGAIGGAINLVRKKPEFDPAYDFSIGGGSFGARRFSFGATGPLNQRLSYRVDLGFEDAGGWRDNSARRFNATPSVLWLATPRDQINFHLTINRDRFATDAGIPVIDGKVPDIPMSRRFNTPQDFALSKDYNGRIFYTHMFSDNVQLRNTISYRYFDDQYLSAESLSVNTRVNPNLVNRQFLYFKHHRRPVFNQAEASWRFSTGFQHQFIAGWEYQRFYNFTHRSAPASIATTPLDLFNPVETHLNRAFPVSQIDYFANTFNAFYGQDQLNLTRRLKALLGFRMDIYRRWTQNNPIVNGVEQPAARITRETEAPTYRAGLVYETTSWWTLYGSVATSFTPVNVVPINNINLTPEEGRQFEIGQRLDFFQRRLNLTMAGYEIERRNVAVLVRSFTNALGVRGSEYDQAARQRSRGFEFDLTGQPFAKLPRLQINTNYGYTDALFLDYFSPSTNFLYTGKEPSFVPRHVGNLWLTYQWRNGLGASIGGRYLSNVYTSNENDVRLGGYATWDAAVSYRRSRWELHVNIYNFLDKERYFTGGIYRTQLYPGKPMNVLATLRFRSR